jgi:hypothetical protein
MGRSVSPEVAHERRGLVEQWEASGLSIAEFTRERGLSYQAFLAWRRRVALEGESGGRGSQSGEASPAARSLFRELVVEPVPLAPDRGAVVEIALPSGAVVRFGAGAAESAVRLAVRVAASC